MKGDIVNKIPFCFRGLRFHRTKPVMNARLSEPLGALRGKDKGAGGHPLGRLEIVGERSAGIVVEIDIPRFPAFVSNMNPTSFARHMGVFHPKPCNIADATASPEAERKDRGAPERAVPFNQAAQNIALVGIEYAWGIERLWRNGDPTSGIAAQNTTVLDQVARKAAHDRLDPRPMTDACASGLTFLQVGIQRGDGQVLRLKKAPTVWAVRQPVGKLAENTRVDVDGSRRFRVQRPHIGGDEISG